MKLSPGLERSLRSLKEMLRTEFLPRPEKEALIALLDRALEDGPVALTEIHAWLAREERIRKLDEQVRARMRV